MKKLLYLIIAIGFIACEGKTSDQKPDLEATEQPETTTDGFYGEKITEDGAIEINQLGEVIEGKDTTIVKLKAVINETCTKKGCWMDVQLDTEESMMVRFKDYGFFVPTGGVDGKTVIFKGKAFRDTTSVEMLQHYAEDAGKTQEEIDAITEPKIALSFEATGVIIKDVQ